MRVPDFSRLVPWLRAIGLFAVGMIVGGAVYMSIHQYLFSQVVMLNMKLESERDKLQAEVGELKKQPYKQTVIRSLVVKTESADPALPLDDLTAQKLGERLERLLKPLFIGQEASTMVQLENIDATRALINRRIILDQSDYLVEMRTAVLLYSELKIWVKARPFTRTE
ncbi:hypothetical protein [Paenibacillus sp. y28]|uniref:hypothetical protein n=1 Tax=Paenibacillus sp. y28 TaxID=3129110 RepID=UPI00301A234D